MKTSRFALTAALLLAAAFSHADNTRVWRQDRFEDFDKGTPNNVSMRSDGVLLLAPRFRTLGDPQLTYIWALVEDSRGRLYAAGGSPGKLVRVTDDKIETVFTAKELEIHSLAVDDKDNIYAATSPDPKIYKIAPDGTSSVFYDPKAKYVWSMAWDPAGFLYVATGDKGEIFRVDRSGNGKLFFSTDDLHARSMVLEKRKTPNGSLIVGTDPGGLIMRVTPSADGVGKGFVLYQAGKKEITALAVAESGPDAGSIYASAVGDKPTRISTLNMAPNQIGMLPVAPPPIFLPGQTSPPSVPGGTEVYRIQADGFPRKLWYSRDETVYAMGFSPAGKLLIATGNKGKLFQIDSDTLHTALLKVTSTQLTSLLLSPKGVVYAGSGNIGKIFEMRAEFEHEGSLESEVFDTRLFARWGRVSWKNQTPAGTSVTMTTRSGNVDDPSRNWSAWSHPYRLKTGEPADSPGARFLQWKISLASTDGKSTPIIDEVEIAYLPKNVAPVVEEVEATPGGYRVNSNTIVQPAQPLTISLQPLGQRANNPGMVTTFNAPLTLNAQRGSQGVRWSSHDDNDDQLSYTVYLRGVNETSWKLLKDHVADRYYFWDANTFPDGLYVSKVIASDAPSNSEQDALTDERVSAPFIIDNTPPVVENMKTAREGNRVRVTFKAVDALSVIKRGEFSVDGGEWQFVPPADGIADSLSEEYSFITPELTAGEHVIAVRVFDKAENGSVEKVVVK